MARHKTSKNQTFFFRGWLMVMVAFCVCIVTQAFGLYSFSIIRIPMTEMLGVDATAVALAFSIYALASALIGLAIGDIIDKLGLRFSLILSAVFFGGGFIYLSSVDSLWQVYVAYAAMAIGNAFGGIIVVSGIPSNWFVKRRGVAVGITWCAMLPGSFITTYCVSTFIALGNWQNAAFVLGVIATVILTTAAFLLRWRPQEIGLYPDGMCAEEAAQVAERAGAAMLVGLNRRQASKTVTFWLIFISFALIAIGEQAPFQLFPTYMVQHGYTISDASSFMTFLALAGCIGKLSSGFILDKLDPRYPYSIFNYSASIGLIALIFSGQSIIGLYVAGFFFGAALSSSTVCLSNATVKFLGPKYFGQLYGLAFLAKPLMESVGVPLLTYISGSSLGWSGVFCVAAVAVGLSATCMIFARKNKQLIAMEERTLEEMSGK